MPKSILIVDDDETILSTYRLALEFEGYVVYTAASGDEGLALAREKLPDLILSDVHMPGTDGRTVLRTIREDPTLGHRQVVLMTGNPHQATPRSGMELGADDFLVKPFTLQELSRCVAARLQRARVHWRVEDRIVDSLRANVHRVLPHEFFTPLAGILGLVDILKSELPNLDPAEVRDMLSEIEGCGWRLQRTLRNYLMALESNETTKAAPIVLTPEVIKGILETAIETVARRTNRKEDIQAELAPVALRAVAADLAIIIEELLENACSFSRHGSPIVVRLDGAGALTVRDKGRGMTPEQIAQVGAFQQFDRKKYEQQGLGLGLTLVQRLVTLHGGTFSVASNPDQGVTARVTFPLAEEAT
jgi:signal transduction histidine kinase